MSQAGPNHSKKQDNLAGDLFQILGRGTVLLIMIGITILQVVTIYQVNSKILSEFIEGRTILGLDKLTGSFLTSIGLGGVSAAESLAFVLALSGIIGITFLASRLRKLLMLSEKLWKGNNEAFIKHYRQKLTFQIITIIPLLSVVCFILVFDAGLFSIQSILTAKEEADMANSLANSMVMQKTLFDTENTLSFLQENLSNMGGFIITLLIIGFMGLTLLTPVLLEISWTGFRKSLDNVIGLCDEIENEDTIDENQTGEKWFEPVNNTIFERR